MPELSSCRIVLTLVVQVTLAIAAFCAMIFFGIKGRPFFVTLYGIEVLVLIGSVCYWSVKLRIQRRNEREDDMDYLLQSSMSELRCLRDIERSGSGIRRKTDCKKPADCKNEKKDKFMEEKVDEFLKGKPETETKVKRLFNDQEEHIYGNVSPDNSMPIETSKTQNQEKSEDRESEPRKNLVGAFRRADVEKVFDDLYWSRGRMIPLAKNESKERQQSATDFPVSEVIRKETSHAAGKFGNTRRVSDAPGVDRASYVLPNPAHNMSGQGRIPEFDTYGRLGGWQQEDVEAAIYANATSTRTAGNPRRAEQRDDARMPTTSYPVETANVSSDFSSYKDPMMAKKDTLETIKISLSSPVNSSEIINEEKPRRSDNHFGGETSQRWKPDISQFLPPVLSRSNSFFDQRNANNNSVRDPRSLGEPSHSDNSWTHDESENLALKVVTGNVESPELKKEAQRHTKENIESGEVKIGKRPTEKALKGVSAKMKEQRHLIKQKFNKKFHCLARKK